MRCAAFRCVLVLALAVAPAAAAELEWLGTRRFACPKGEVHLESERGKLRYAPGKREKIRVEAPTGLLRYSCKYVRSVVTCPLDTTAVTVRRVSYDGRFEVECLGELQTRIDDLDELAEPGATEAEAGGEGADEAAAGEP